jgi:hypothetical protein
MSNYMELDSIYYKLLKLNKKMIINDYRDTNIKSNIFSNSILVVLLFEIAEALLSNVIIIKNAIDIKIAKTKNINKEQFAILVESSYPI